MTTVYERQLQILEARLQKVPEDAPNRGLWESALHVLAFLGGSLEELTTLIKGNGKDGLLDRVDKVEKSVSGLRNDMRDTLAIVRELGGYAGNYNKDNNPGRRREDQPVSQSQSDKLLAWFQDKVLPALVIVLITSFFSTFTLLVVLNWLDMLPLK